MLLTLLCFSFAIDFFLLFQLLLYRIFRSRATNSKVQQHYQGCNVNFSDWLWVIARKTENYNDVVSFSYYENCKNVNVTGRLDAENT